MVMQVNKMYSNFVLLLFIILWCQVMVTWLAGKQLYYYSFLLLSDVSYIFLLFLIFFIIYGSLMSVNGHMAGR